MKNKKGLVDMRVFEINNYSNNCYLYYTIIINK